MYLGESGAFSFRVTGVYDQPLDDFIHVSIRAFKLYHLFYNSFDKVVKKEIILTESYLDV